MSIILGTTQVNGETSDTLTCLNVTVERTANSAQCNQSGVMMIELRCIVGTLVPFAVWADERREWNAMLQSHDWGAWKIKF